MAFNWTCPHCATRQTVADEKIKVSTVGIPLKDQAEGNIVARLRSIGCVNEECKKISINLKIARGYYSGGSYYVDTDEPETLFEQDIRPHGSSKPQPDYIPTPLLADYREACLIRDLSPKASATLVRRCLQGMIRDFTGIAKARLIDEISALRSAVDDGKAPEGVSLDSVDAIDAVRKIGNIGAHMEKDIDILVDVDPGEAQLLIDLVEMLFEEWYVQRHKRRERLVALTSMARAKQIEIDAMKELRAADDGETGD